MHILTSWNDPIKKKHLLSRAKLKTHCCRNVSVFMYKGWINNPFSITFFTLLFIFTGYSNQHP
jgi:hypothetical protein